MACVQVLRYTAGADSGILKGGAPIMKSDNEVRNGCVHQKGVGAGGGFCSCTLKMPLKTLNCATMNK